MKNSLFRDKFDVKIARNSRLEGGCPGEEKSRLGYVLKTSGHACVQYTSIRVPPSPAGVTLVVCMRCIGQRRVNSSQLAKLKKSIALMLLP